MTAATHKVAAMTAETTDTEPVTAGVYHDWVPIPEQDAVACATCGLVVSITEFRSHRDSKCDDWLEK